MARIARRQSGIDRRWSEARIWALASAAGIGLRCCVDPAIGMLVTLDVRAKDLDVSATVPDEAALEAIGTLAAQFHGLPASGLPRTDPAPLSDKPTEPSPAAPTSTSVIQLADATPGLSSDVVAHGDLIAANVLLGARPWLVDFETAGRGDPDFDLVGLACTLDLDADRTAVLYRGAGRELPVPTRLRELKRLFALREHAWALARIAEGRTEGTIARQRDTSLRALRNLSTGA